VTSVDPRLPVPRPYGRRAGDRAPLKVALVGVGAMGSHHARVIGNSSRARLYAVVDQNLDQATAMADRIGCLATSDLEVAARADAVIVATPTEFHLDVALPLLAAGRPLLVEKPLAPDLASVRTLVAEAEQRDVPLLCGFVERFNPVIGAAMDVLTGPPVHLVSLRHSPPAPRIAISVVADMLIHDLDLAVGFADLADVENLTSEVWTPPGSPTPDIADCTIRFAGGMLATLSASRRSQRKIRSFMISTEAELVELDLLRQDVSVYRHVRHEQIGGTSTTYRAETVVDIPFVRQTGEPLALQFEYFLDMVEGRVDLKEERQRMLPAHELAERIDRRPEGSL
jgi:predicted dehydrogenase